MKKMASKRRKRKKLFRYVFLILLSLVLFKVGKKAAFRWRGYEAVGGEYLIPLYPAIIYILEQTVEDWRNMSKREKKEDASR